MMEAHDSDSDCGELSEELDRGSGAAEALARHVVFMGAGGAEFMKIVDTDFGTYSASIRVDVQVIDGEKGYRK